MLLKFIFVQYFMICKTNVFLSIFQAPFYQSSFPSLVLVQTWLAVSASYYSTQGYTVKNWDSALS